MNGQPNIEVKCAKMGKAKKMLYGIDEVPPLIIMLPVAFQHLVFCFGSMLSIIFIVADSVCAPITDPVRAQLFCSSLFMVGLTTTIQVLLGVRLPIFQGPAQTFLFPLIVVWKCPQYFSAQDSWSNVTLTSTNMTYLVNITNITVTNETMATLVNTTTSMLDLDRQQLIYDRINELQGSLMLASLVEVVLGATGMMGTILRFVSPISIAVTITLVGISLHPIPAMYSSCYWPVALLCAALMLLFAFYLTHVRLPLPSTSCCRGNQAQGPTTKIPVFDIMSIPLSVAVCWILCFVLTMIDFFPDDPDDPTYRARTDARGGIIRATPWFFIPYPGQFGYPKINIPIFLGFLFAFIASAIESVGDYFAVAEACNAEPPPTHAINRGILTEGLLSLLSGAVGTGHATTSYSVSAAIPGITKVGSRYVLVLAGILAMLMGVVGKVGAVMCSIPEPVVGGVSLVGFGIIVGIGVSTLRAVDLTSSRNISIIGTSIFGAVVISEWLSKNKGAIDTGDIMTGATCGAGDAHSSGTPDLTFGFCEGSEEWNNIIRLMLGTPMMVGCIISVFLDNTVRGTDLERGLMSYEDSTPCPDVSGIIRTSKDLGHINSQTEELIHKGRNSMDRDETIAIYDLPYIGKLQRQISCLRYIPFLQPYYHKHDDSFTSSLDKSEHLNTV